VLQGAAEGPEIEQHADPPDPLRLQKPRRDVAANIAEKSKKKIRATLGGIVARRDGAIVTNHQGISGCAKITLTDQKKKRHTAILVGSDLKSDEALLRAEERFAKAAAFRRNDPTAAGESLSMVGYPLAAILGTDPHVNAGYVTALAGLRGDSTHFQSTAPIYNANRGDPVLDQSGRVPGIVTAKLNALAGEKRTGDLLQNIGFAVRGELAQRFLERYDVSLQSETDGSKLDNAEVAVIGRAVTVLIAGRKNP